MSHLNQHPQNGCFLKEDKMYNRNEGEEERCKTNLQNGDNKWRRNTGRRKENPCGGRGEDKAKRRIWARLDKPCHHISFGGGFLCSFRVKMGGSTNFLSSFHGAQIVRELLKHSFLGGLSANIHNKQLVTATVVGWFYLY
jgi:hypothetical protein